MRILAQQDYFSLVLLHYICRHLLYGSPIINLASCLDENEPKFVRNVIQFIFYELIRSTALQLSSCFSSSRKFSCFSNHCLLACFFSHSFLALYANFACGDIVVTFTAVSQAESSAQTNEQCECVHEMLNNILLFIAQRTTLRKV